MPHKEKVSIVLSCIDYRFWPEALPMLEKEFGEFDLIELAGGSKNLASPTQAADKDAVLESIKVAVDLHGAKQIILTNHIDCGAYGGSEKFSTPENEIEFHKSELEKAERVILGSFPGLRIQKVIITFGHGGKVEMIFSK